MIIHDIKHPTEYLISTLHDQRRHLKAASQKLAEVINQETELKSLLRGHADFMASEVNSHEEIQIDTSKKEPLSFSFGGVNSNSDQDQPPDKSEAFDAQSDDGSDKSEGNIASDYCDEDPVQQMFVAKEAHENYIRREIRTEKQKLPTNYWSIKEAMKGYQ